MNACFDNEILYKEIKYQSKTLFPQTKVLMNILDSNRSCDLVGQYGLNVTACYLDIGVNLPMDSMSWMQLFLGTI